MRLAGQAEYEERPALWQTEKPGLASRLRACRAAPDRRLASAPLAGATQFDQAGAQLPVPFAIEYQQRQGRQ